MLANSANGGPVALAAQLALLLFPSPVDGDEQCPFALEHFAQTQRVGERGQQANLHGVGDSIGMKSAHDGLDAFIVREQIGAVPAFPRDALRTSQIQIDVLADRKHDLGSARYSLRVVSAQLRMRAERESDLDYKRCVPLARRKVVLEILVSRRQQVRVEHLRETHVAVIVSNQHAEGKIALLNLGVNPSCHPNHRRQHAAEWYYGLERWKVPAFRHWRSHHDECRRCELIVLNLLYLKQ